MASGPTGVADSSTVKHSVGLARFKLGLDVGSFCIFQGLALKFSDLPLTDQTTKLMEPFTCSDAKRRTSKTKPSSREARLSLGLATAAMHNQKLQSWLGVGVLSPETGRIDLSPCSDDKDHVTLR